MRSPSHNDGRVGLHLMRTYILFAALVSLSVTVAPACVPNPRLATVISSIQGPRNLVDNSAADRGTDAWRPEGTAVVEEFNGNRCFVVRNGGRLRQKVTLPADAAGKFVLFIAHVSGERVASDITDRPYLYGLTFSVDGRHILLHNQAETMRSNAERVDQWTKAWGVFPVPDHSAAIWYQLGQGRRNGSPHTGSAARFDDVGLFVFDTRSEAEAFVSRYR